MRGGKGFAVTTALIIVLILVVAGMGGYILVSRNSSSGAEEQTERRAVLVTEENVDQVVEGIVETPPSANSYIARMNSEWHFPDGASPSTDAYVANSPDNKWPVWFDVTLGDGRTVYESPILPVDTYLQNFALAENLEAGTYGGTITYHLVDDDQNELSTLSIGISIIVEN